MNALRWLSAVVLLGTLLFVFGVGLGTIYGWVVPVLRDMCP